MGSLTACGITCDARAAAPVAAAVLFSASRGIHCASVTWKWADSARKCDGFLATGRERVPDGSEAKMTVPRFAASPPSLLPHPARTICPAQSPNPSTVFPLLSTHRADNTIPSPSCRYVNSCPSSNLYGTVPFRVASKRHASSTFLPFSTASPDTVPVPIRSPVRNPHMEEACCVSCWYGVHSR